MCGGDAAFLSNYFDQLFFIIQLYNLRDEPTKTNELNHIWWVLLINIGLILGAISNFYWGESPPKFLTGVSNGAFLIQPNHGFI